MAAPLAAQADWLMATRIYFPQTGSAPINPAFGTWTETTVCPPAYCSYLARMARLRGELEIVGVQPTRDLSARRATEWLDALAETWQKTVLVEEKSDVINAVYERIVIEGPRFVGLRLTPAAYRHGLAFALPDAVMARPTGVGGAITTYSMPIEGRHEWLTAAARHLA